ncbi:MAG: twin-arginine translocation signal domain-containing protein [Opitutaceae bacterium]|nr:twin-arginine translocation signal domain-containing protein [Opitutaceae bacterium]
MTSLSRRHFLAASSAVVAAALLPRNLHAASVGSTWPVGCFNRPWTKWSYEETLDAIKAGDQTENSRPRSKG